MSKRLIYVIALVALSMLTILEPASAQIFYADFEDGAGVNDPAQWVPDNTGQAWGIANFPGSGKGLKNLNEGCGTSGNTPLPGVDNFQDGIIQLDMSWEDDDSWGVVFRKTADDAGYLVVFGYIETPFVLITDLADGCATTGQCLSDSGCENGGKELIAVPNGLGTNLTQDLSVSYTGRIEAIGDMIRVWFLPTADIADPLGDLGAPLVEYQHSAHLEPGSVGVWHESQGGSMIDNVMVFTAGGNPLAWAPNPPEGALVKETWVNLSWRAGDYAVSHDLYIGDNFDDVNNGTHDSGTFAGNQAATFSIAGFPGFPLPSGLIPGTTYYWRVDEVNDANAASPWKGNIWNFSTQPYIAYDPKPVDGAEFVDPASEFSWTPGYGAKLHTVYMGTDYDTVNNAAGGPPVGPAKYKPAKPLDPEKVYYWRVDEFDAVVTHKGDIWAFTTPGAAGNPKPATGSTGASMVGKLSWTPATSAVSHDVYLGTDKDAVRNATKASPEFKGNKALGSESLDPGKLAWFSDYYWRVDAVYSTGTVKGLVWSFTTADFISVDDFESYNDIDPPDAASNRIFDKWIDGFGTTNNGALVGNDLPPYAEQAVIHSGTQSMPYNYDNTNKTSEATLTLSYPRNWTEEGVTKLVLWFRGASANAADKMYVALNGNAVVYHDDSAATQKGGWNKWIIDLQAFANQGVNLTNVNTITIGIGTKGSPAAGGTGTIYFDDIRLYR